MIPFPPDFQPFPENVVELCIVSAQTGGIECIDTMFQTRAVLDCADVGEPADLYGSERFSGYVWWGNRIGADLDTMGYGKYNGGGWQVVSFPLVRAVYVVDEDVIFDSSFDGACKAWAD